MKIENEKMDIEKVVFDEISDESLVSRETIYEKSLPVQTKNLEFELIFTYTEIYTEGTEGIDSPYELKHIDIQDEEGDLNIWGCNDFGTFEEQVKRELTCYFKDNYDTFGKGERPDDSYVTEVINKIFNKIKETLKEENIV